MHVRCILDRRNSPCESINHGHCNSSHKEFPHYNQQIHILARKHTLHSVYTLRDLNRMCFHRVSRLCTCAPRIRRGYNPRRDTYYRTRTFPQHIHLDLSNRSDTASVSHMHDRYIPDDTHTFRAYIYHALHNRWGTVWVRYSPDPETLHHIYKHPPHTFHATHIPLSMFSRRCKLNPRIRVHNSNFLECIYRDSSRVEVLDLGVLVSLRFCRVPRCWCTFSLYS